jgi:enoyl-CoA hydratase
MTQDFIIQEDSDILRITLNRPETGNAVSDEMAGELAQLLTIKARDFRLVALRGAGADFCVGRATGRARLAAPEALQRRRSTEVIFNCYGAFRETPVPVVGLVQGKALGFGCSIAALCDVTIATEDATFQIPEMSHGTMPTMVMSSLVDRLPRKVISHLVYTSAAISAERALSFGIASDIVRADLADAYFEETCAAILRAPPPATLGVKEYLRTAMDMDVRGAVDYARNIHATINSSSEMKRR